MKKECPHLKKHGEIIINMLKSGKFRDLFIFLLASLKAFPLLKELGITKKTYSFCKLANNLCPHSINSEILAGVLGQGYNESQIFEQYPDFYISATLGQGMCDIRRTHQAKNN